MEKFLSVKDVLDALEVAHACVTEVEAHGPEGCGTPGCNCKPVLVTEGGVSVIAVIEELLSKLTEIAFKVETLEMLEGLMSTAKADSKKNEPN